MFKEKPGLAIVETIMVIAISGLLFAVVIGTLSIRRRSAVDDSARQVMSEIAKVRNQAQQGYIPPDQVSATPSLNKELYGMAIEFGNNSGVMTVRYLQQDPVSKNISAFGDYIINMPSQLKWYISSLTSVSNDCNNSFNSCKKITPSGAEYLPEGTMWLVFRNNNGQSYLLTPSQATRTSNYNVENQSNIRFAFAQPASGVDLAAQFKNAPAQYYANFDLSIINNQALEVVK